MERPALALVALDLRVVNEDLGAVGNREEAVAALGVEELDGSSFAALPAAAASGHCVPAVHRRRTGRSARGQNRVSVEAPGRRHAALRAPARPRSPATPRVRSDRTGARSSRRRWPGRSARRTGRRRRECPGPRRRWRPRRWSACWRRWPGRGPLRLRPVAVDGGGLDACRPQLLGHPVGAALGPTEHEGLTVPGDQLGGDVHPLDPGGVPEVVGHVRRLRSLGENVAASRVTLVTPADGVDLLAHGAENSRTSTPCAVWSTRRHTGRTKPMSTIRSASSRTTVRTSVSTRSPCARRSSRRPGQATTMSAPRRRAWRWVHTPSRRRGRPPASVRRRDP